MKKTIALMLLAVLVLTLAACGTKHNAPADPNTVTTGAPVTTEAPTTTEPTTTEAPATTEAPTTTTAPTTTEAPKRVDLSALSSEIISALGITDAMPLQQDRLTDLYGIAQNDIASAGCFITVNGSFPEEAIMIEAANDAAKDNIVAALNTRLGDVLIQAQNYDAENYALAKQCKVLTNGNYVAMFVSAQHAAMEALFDGALS